jgi:glycosyltransferase involved in cell wall biosynthesis
MSTPLISVIIPTHNGAAWLPDCLDSVLRQTYERREVLVIDDGSTDATPAVLRAFEPRVCVVRQPRGGIGAARNQGIHRAAGDYLAFLDHDDLWKEDKLDKQVRHALAHPEIDVHYTDAEEFDARGTVHDSFFALFPGLRRSGDLFAEIVHFAVPLMSTTLFKTAFLHRHGLTFPESVSGVDDVGLLLEIAARGGVFGHSEERLVARRLHAHNLSKNHYNRFAQRAVLYADLLERLQDAQPTHRAALEWGLRDARFRLGECAWADLQLSAARRYFRSAVGLDRLGRRALRAYLLSLLPVAAVRGLRAAKQATTRRQGLRPIAAR